MESPELSTERLLIRRLRADDAAAMYRYRSHPSVTRFQTWHPASVEQVRFFAGQMEKQPFNAEDSWFQLAICLRRAPELIGDLGLHFLGPQNQQVEIAYTVSPMYRRIGLAFEAATCVVTHLFSEMNKHRVTASVAPDNEASIALLRKLGMRMEGRFKESVLQDGKWVDDVVFAVLRDEWAASHPH